MAYGESMANMTQQSLFVLSYNDIIKKVNVIPRPFLVAMLWLQASKLDMTGR